MATKYLIVFVDMSFATWMDRNFGKPILNFFKSGPFRSLTNSLTGAGPTGAKLQEQDYNTSERIAAQNWTAQREDSAMQRTMADYKAAGVNPMMAVAGGVNPTSASQGAQSSADAPSMSLSDIMQLSVLPEQKELMKAQSENLRAGADEKKAKTPYWTQRIEESKKKIDSMSAGIDKDIALAANYWAQTATEEQLRDAREHLMVSQRALADAQTALAQASEKNVNADTLLKNSEKVLKDFQAAYQKSLNDNGMAEKVCQKIVAEANLAGKQASTEEQKKIAGELSNALMRGDFVQVASKQIRDAGNNTGDWKQILSEVYTALNKATDMINITVAF